MKYEELLEYLDQNQELIDSYGKLDAKLLKQISYKFRLDWNYYSNRIEGGTLTLEETKSVMANLLKIDNKSKKDYMEMDGHDKEVLDILKITKGQQSISPKRIKEMHKNIMYEEDPKKRRGIGEWKKENNYLLNYKDERIDFTPYLDVPDKIQELCNWVNAELDKYHAGKSKLHAVQLAAQFHYEYVCIHPFYDGNGRTARLLTNLILISCGFSPIIIKDEHKDAYGKTLADAQVYDKDNFLFYQFIGDRLMESQILMLNAINGESIEEDDDLDKRLQLLDQQFELLGNETVIEKVLDKDVLNDLTNNWVFRLIDETLKVVLKFNKYYLHSDHSLTLDISHNIIETNTIGLRRKIPISESLKKDLSIEISQISDELVLTGGLINLNLYFLTFKKAGKNSFNYSSNLKVKLERTHYELSYTAFDENYRGDDLSQMKPIVLEDQFFKVGVYESMIKQISTRIGNSILDHMDFKIKQQANQK